MGLTTNSGAMPTPVVCDHCKQLIKAVDPNKHIGIQIEEAGGVYKIPILWNGSSDPLYFCSFLCKDTYYEVNIPKNPKMTKILAEMKAEIPKMAEETAKHMFEFRDKLLNLQNKNRNNGN